MVLRMHKCFKKVEHVIIDNSQVSRNRNYISHLWFYEFVNQVHDCFTHA